jgi:predicted amidohydrolase
VHNTLLLVAPDGSLAATYRKVHLYDAHGVRESQWIAPGEPGDTPMLELDGLRVGAQTCYDLRFPEATRVLVDAGADVVVVPAQWVPGPRKEDHWSTLLRARAIENTVYVAAAGQSAPTGSGCSMVIDPMGVVVAGLGDRVGVAAAPVDRERIEQVRSNNPVLTARRYEVVTRQS